MKNVAPTAQQLTDLSLGTIDGIMQRHAIAVQSSYMRLRYVVGDPHYKVGDHVVVVRPIGKKRLSDFLVYHDVVTSTEVFLLGIDAQTGTLRNHLLGTLEEFGADPARFGLVWQLGCPSHHCQEDKPHAEFTYCNFRAEVIAEAILHHLPTSGHSFGC